MNSKSRTRLIISKLFPKRKVTRVVYETSCQLGVYSMFRMMRGAVRVNIGNRDVIASTRVAKMVSVRR